MSFLRINIPCGIWKKNYKTKKPNILSSTKRWNPILEIRMDIVTKLHLSGRSDNSALEGVIREELVQFSYKIGP